MNMKPSWAYGKEERWNQLEFNKNFLRKVENECGTLFCEYCGKGDLVIYEWWEKSNHTIMATVDHFYPVSKFNKLKQNEKNFIVSCVVCNTKKKDDIWDVESIKHPRNNEIISTLIKINKTYKMINNSLKSDFYDILVGDHKISAIGDTVISVIESEDVETMYNYENKVQRDEDYMTLCFILNIFEERKR